MSYHYVLGADGRTPVVSDLMAWARGSETGHREQRAAGAEPAARPGVGWARVANTDLPGGRRVSTVFLGLDHRFGGVGPPILFETMVFGGVNDQDGRRYSTWDEAEAGHAEFVDRELTSLAAAFA